MEIKLNLNIITRRIPISNNLQARERAGLEVVHAWPWLYEITYSIKITNIE